MSEIFLVALSKPETAAGLLAAALTAAKQAGPVRIDVLAVRMPPMAMVVPSDEVVTGEHLAILRDGEAARTGSLKEIYDSWSAKAGSGDIAAAWIEVEGIPAEEVASRARNADLVIVDRPTKPQDDASRQTLHAAIFDSHRPVLIVPPNSPASLGRRLAIAWRDDERAVKAIIPALRYFAGAAEISVLVGYRGGAEPKDTPPPLAERGIAANIQPLRIGSEPFGQTLLAAARQIGADLLVMGAYTHSPLREMLLGGTTKYILAHAEIPVLMRH